MFKRRILEKKKWDLNICCGKTDGGGINADIVPHIKVPRMAMVDIYNLPFKNNQFDTVLCSHTIEHTHDPERFYDELRRVGRDVTLVIPPLWDISAVVNLLEHRWIFLSWKKEHKTLPKFIKLPLARTIQNRLGQKVSA
jgi:ubiquinone/menaquinone biosynthesis C-methylase UbiE